MSSYMWKAATLNILLLCSHEKNLKCLYSCKMYLSSSQTVVKSTVIISQVLWSMAPLKIIKFVLKSYFVYHEINTQDVTAEGNEDMEETAEDRKLGSATVTELTCHVCRRSVLLGIDLPLSAMGKGPLLPVSERTHLKYSPLGG